MPKSGKFGTFGGVFTPSILTILGVIMYMRLGWVVGNAGTLTSVFVIILMAHVVSITTGLSVSSIATDKKIKAGGIYYMLSRSLGFPIGGAIGVTLFVATAMSIALYLIGFGESALLVMQDSLGIEEVTTNHLRIVGSLALLMIVTIAFISTSIAIKTQYFILAAIVLSLISIVFGTTEGKGFDFSEVASGDVNFAVLFGIFFPAVTGFTAGVAMSGDLKDPKKSIPWGTMLAVATGLIVYMGLAAFIFYKIPTAELQNNNNALVEFGWIPQFVVAGIWGATLSSALGGILGAPRILQAMSLDRITPTIFAKGTGKDNEPRNALILTFILAEAGILVGELDVIAEVVAMFYLAAYMFINLSGFLEQWASPDFRPTFKISIVIPFIGALATLLLMIQLNIAATIASVIIILVIFLWLTRKQLELGTGDVWQNVWSSVVKFGLKNLNKGDIHKRNWEPNILLFSGGTKARPHLIEFGTSVAGRNGMISNFDLIEDKTAKVLFPKQEQSILNEDTLDDAIFYRKKTCKDLYEGIETISSTYGFSGVEPNTILMGWASNIKRPERFAEMARVLHELDYNVLFLDYDKEKGFGQKQKIDIWWRDLSQISYFTVQLVKLINASPDWSNASVRFLYFDNENNEKSVLETEMKKRIQELRKNVEIEVIQTPLKDQPFYEVVKNTSHEADLIIIDLPELGQGTAQEFVEDTNELLNVLGTTLIVKASSHFYEKSDFNTTLEKVYAADDQPAIEESKSADSQITLGSCYYEELDKYIIALDENIQHSNLQLGNKIYASYASVLQSFTNLLEIENDDDKAEKTAILLKDLKENRLNVVSNGLSDALNEQFDAFRNFIQQMPVKVVRKYQVEELKPKFGDTDEILKFKKSIRNPLTSSHRTIRLRKLSLTLFDSTYLVHFEKVLHSFGESVLVFNAIIKKWAAIDTNGASSDLQTTMERALQEEASRFIEKMDHLGRKFCNTIIKEVDQLHSDRLPTLSKVKPRTSVIKVLKTNIIQYPQYWHSNTQYLNNHLLLNLRLQSLKKRIMPLIAGVKASMINQMLAPGSELLSGIHKNIDNLTEQNIDQHKNSLIEAGSSLNIDEILKDLMLNIDQELDRYCNETEVIPARQIKHFGSLQMEISAEMIDVKKVTDYLLDNEVLVLLKTNLQTDFNDIKSELLKVENALQLLKYSWSANQNDSAILLSEVKTKLDNQFDESEQTFDAIQLRLEAQISNTFKLLDELLTDEIIIDRASQMNAIIRKQRTKQGVKRYTDKLRFYWEVVNNKIDSGLIQLHDFWTISDHQYRTKSLQNPHTRLANYVDDIALSSTMEKQIPFFYHQLFTGKHNAPQQKLANRQQEWAAANKAINRFKNGHSGAILFTGEPLSGLSYLLENVINTLINKKVIQLKAPRRHNRLAEKLIHESLILATDIHEDTATILGKLPTGTVIIIEDLELWWTRRAKGSDYIQYINDLIAQHGHRLLFIMSTNVYFYQHIRQYIDIDANLLDTIMVNPLGTEEIKRVLLKRHHSGGMSYHWNQIPEKELSIREQNKLFRRITNASEGNIGTALFLWLGNIQSIEDNNVHIGELILDPIPPVLSAEWEIMLLQLLLHKQLTFSRLCSIYSSKEKQTVKAILDSLIRANLLVETTGRMIKINPYVQPYLVRYFRRCGVV